MRLKTAIELGRVSNLPTVWTNVLAAAALAGGDIRPLHLIAVAVSASLLYVGGMYLNDAFDAEIDRQQRPERPIPRGEVSRQTVLTIGGSLLASAVAILIVAAFVTPGGTWHPVAAAAGTALAVVVYDLWHKGNPVGPVIMGACRLGVYLIAAYSVTPEPPGRVFVGGLLLLGYVVGLTWVAKHEDGPTDSGKVVVRSWPVLLLFGPVIWAVPALRGDLLLRLVLIGFCMWALQALDWIRQGRAREAVGALIAGIALVDALVIVRYESVAMTMLALAAFGLTVASQRRIAGT